MEANKTVALVLGSGGARGYAHLGAIEVLEERGYQIIAVSGCSMGALVGGIYAAGKLKEFKDWATSLDRFDILKLLDLSFSTPGAIRGDKIFSVVRELIGDTLIEELPLPYTAVATDLLNHKEVWFQEGLLHKAIRASVAIPSLMTPEMVKERVLVDGGLLNPLPIIPTISAHADLIVAVNLSYYDAHFEQQFYRDIDVKKEGKSFDEWATAVWERATLLFEKRAHSDEDEPSEDLSIPAADKKKSAISTDITVAAEAKQTGLQQELEKGSNQIQASSKSRYGSMTERPQEMAAAEPPEAAHSLVEKAADVVLQGTAAALNSQRILNLGKFEAMNMAFEAMQSSLTQYKIAGYPPDILVNIPKVVCKTFDYHKAPELIRLGREITEKTLNSYEHGSNR